MVSINDLVTLSKVNAPCASVYLPTHLHGQETMSDSRQFHHLINDAASQLRRRGISSMMAESLLNPARVLAQHETFWQHQSAGLALFASPEFWSHHSLHRPVREQLVVNDIFFLRQLVPFVTDGEMFHVLALSQKSIRFYTGGRFTIARVDVPGLPDSIDEDLWYEMPQSELQVRSGGSHTALFHGHGLGDELRKERLERFFGHVDHAVARHLAESDRPVVLAGVGYYIGIFRQLSTIAHLTDTFIEGSVDRRTDTEIHAAGWDAVKEVFAEPIQRKIDQFRNVRGTGLTIESLPEILEAATEGRVDTLFLGDTTVALDDVGESLLNTAIRRSLRTGALTCEAPGLVDDPSQAYALLRY